MPAPQLDTSASRPRTTAISRGESDMETPQLDTIRQPPAKPPCVALDLADNEDDNFNTAATCLTLSVIDTQMRWDFSTWTTAKAQ